jgi:hypothetical protein
MRSTTIVPGVVLMFLSMTMMASAYHIPQDGSGGIPGDDWVVGNGQVNACESLGQDDKVNGGIPLARPGIGGLCYASSQNFTTVCNLGTGGYVCVFNKTAEKEKKPLQNGTRADYGRIEPKCVDGAGCSVPRKNATTAEDPLGLVSGFHNWFIRIGSNARSCNGAWGQTFVYKEIIAYYAGSAINPETGASGHVTFFVNDLNVAGTYNSDKLYNKTAAEAGISVAKSSEDFFGDPICTGNYSGWGLMAGGECKGLFNWTVTGPVGAFSIGEVRCNDAVVFTGTCTVTGVAGTKECSEDIDLPDLELNNCHISARSANSTAAKVVKCLG